MTYILKSSMKRIVAIIMMVLAVMMADAADLRTLFVDMPDSIMPTLTKSDRMDFVDYMDSGMKAKARNKLGGESEMTLFQDNMLSVKTSQVGRMDIVLFPRKKGSDLICVIKTVTARYDDSSLSFYDENWTPIDSKNLIEIPHFDDYLTKEALKSDSLDVFRKMSMLRLQSITAVDGALEFRYTSLEYIGEDAERYKTWIKSDPIRYIWTGKCFKLKK